MSDMTSAVAIDLLDNLIGMVDDNQGNDYDSALHMAIDALKAQADGDTISRQAAIDALAKAMPSLTTPDGSGEFDHDIQITDEAFVDCMQIINELPSAQPEEIDSESCNELKKKCEELKAHIEYLRRQNDSMKGEIKALIFAVRCCGVSGNEVQYESD